VDAECPGDPQAMDDSIERNANNSAACTASSKNDTVRKSTPAEEVLRRSNSNSLQTIVSLVI